MYNNKKFKLTILLLCAVLMISLTGCDVIPTLKLTETESRIIAEYAAGLLLKYDKNYEGNLQTLKEEEELEIVNEHAPLSEKQDNAKPDFNSDDDASKKKNSPDVEYSDIPIAEALGLEGFDVTFSDMESAQIYPEEEGEVLFSMQAQPGMEFLVMHFNVTNSTEGEKTCDVLTKNALFRIIIDGNERVASQRTILMDDFSQYNDAVAGYGMVDSVLVFELSSGASESINTLDLVINCNDTNYIYKIK